MHALAEPPRHNSLQLTTQLHRGELNNRHVCMHVLQSTDLTHTLCHVKATGSVKFGVHCTDLDAVNHLRPQQQLPYRHMHMHKLQLLMNCCICIKSQPGLPGRLLFSHLHHICNSHITVCILLLCTSCYLMLEMEL